MLPITPIFQRMFSNRCYPYLVGPYALFIDEKNHSLIKGSLNKPKIQTGTGHKRGLGYTNKLEDAI